MAVRFGQDSAYLNIFNATYTFMCKRSQVLVKRRVEQVKKVKQTKVRFLRQRYTISEVQVAYRNLVRSNNVTWCWNITCLFFLKPLKR